MCYSYNCYSQYPQKTQKVINCEVEGLVLTICAAESQRRSKKCWCTKKDVCLLVNNVRVLMRFVNDAFNAMEVENVSIRIRMEKSKEKVCSR